MLDDISIDYAIMEKAQNLVAIPFKSKWSDLGGWDAVWSESNPDARKLMLASVFYITIVPIIYVVDKFLH